MHRFLVILFSLMISINPVTYTSASSINRWCLIFTPWNMFIVNGINEDITIHVRSKDDDLGNHTLPYNGIYNWSFCDTGRTLFWSKFWWGSKYQSFNVFDVHSIMMCDKLGFAPRYCYWLVRPEGFYIGKVNNPFPSGSWHFVNPWA